MGNTQHPVFIEIGVITRPHGITGEVKVQTSPGYLGSLEGVKRVFLNNAPAGTGLLGCRVHQNAILLRLEGIDTRNAAETLRGVTISISIRDLPRLAKGEYYAHELVGLRVEDGMGKSLGQLSEVLATGSNDVYVVKTAEGSELLLPAIESVIRNIDIAANIMSVIVPEGLIS